MANFQLCVTAPLAVFALFVGLAPSTVHGHGYLIQPKTSFTGYGGGYSAIVQNSTLTPPAGKRFIWFQDQIAGIFEAALKPTGKSLKNFILENQDTSVQAEGAPKPHSAACGYSLPNGAPQDLPDKLQWKMDFLHPGPCEVYCDDELVVPYTTDCWTKFSDNMIPYNKAKCVGKKQLTLYFLAVHYPPWQVYSNCDNESASDECTHSHDAGSDEGEANNDDYESHDRSEANEDQEASDDAYANANGHIHASHSDSNVATAFRFDNRPSCIDHHPSEQAMQHQEQAKALIAPQNGLVRKVVDVSIMRHTRSSSCQVVCVSNL
ncbi:hypothetical protein FI667_g17141, partial [Globisporangium splendens]